MAINVFTLPNTHFAPMTTLPATNRAFSLLELLAVIFIIGIVAVFVTPAASTILKGSQLTQAEQIVTDQIKLARQMAVTKNRSIQVRFIRYGDPEVPGERRNDPATGFYRAIQVFEILESGAAVPLDKPQLLPQAIIMSPGDFSTLVSHTDVQPPMQANKAKVTDANGNTTGGDPAIPRGIDWDYQFVSFRFLPDGSTNLSSTAGTMWHVTLHNINERPNGAAPPPNFVTLQVDPVSGTVRIFRPSV
jgi:uncharacterized protein (TIGR02596 family)